MKKMLVVLATVLSFLAGSISIVHAFTTSDLVGTWYMHCLMTGDDNSWAYATVDIDIGGNCITSSGLTSDGGTPNLDGTINITADGIVTLGESESTHGIMNPSKDIMVITYTSSGSENNYGLMVAVKAGETFATADLEGTWDFHGLISGDDSDTPGWYYSQITIDSEGNSIHTAPVTDSLGNSDFTPAPGVMDISVEGIITNTLLSGDYRWVMNPDKEIIAGVFTGAPGNEEDVNGYNLIILSKSDTGFTTSDFEGTWHFHGLDSGDDSEWFYGIADMDSEGNYIETLYVDNDGDGAAGGTAIFDIADDGIVTIQTQPSYHGAMNLMKNMIVFTGGSIVIMTKAEENEEDNNDNNSDDEDDDSSGGGKSGCFIATACYGTPSAKEVITLRQFRDECLLTNPLGKGFVNVYYKISPPVADFIRQHPVLKTITREFLKPLIWMAKENQK